MKIFSLFTEYECNEIITLLNNNFEWEYCTDESGKSYYKIIVDSDFKYYNKVKDFVDTIMDTPSNGVLHFLRYEKGDGFPEHIDVSNKSEFHYDGKYNVNAILNSNYIGGKFKLSGKELETEIGDAYIYESTTPHEVTKVIDGIRYVMMYYIRARDIQGFEKNLV